jgi:hypothetical protein
MRVLRFMSAAEAIKLIVGQEVENQIDHHNDHKNKTDSVGFCFMLAIADDSDADQEIYQASQFLSGIVDMDCCFVGRLKDDHIQFYHQGWGDYSGGRKLELSITHYALTDFREWEFWAPQRSDSIFKMLASPNWIDPTVIIQSEA